MSVSNFEGYVEDIVDESDGSIQKHIVTINKEKYFLFAKPRFKKGDYIRGEWTVIPNKEYNHICNYKIVDKPRKNIKGEVMPERPKINLTPKDTSIVRQVILKILGENCKINNNTSEDELKEIFELGNKMEEWLIGQNY